MQGKGIYIILLGIIAVLTLSVAVLSIFLFVTFNQTVATGTVAAAEESGHTSESGSSRVVPGDELRTWSPFSSGEGEKVTVEPAVYDLKPSEGHTGSFVQVTLLMKYDVGVKREHETEYALIVEEESASEIKQACSMYFKGLTYEDCKSPEAIPMAQDALKEEFNRIVDESAGEEIGIVYKVIIENMLAQ